MSVPPKPVFAGGTFPTSMGSALADLAAYGVYPPGALARRQTNQSIASGAATAVSFDAELFDNTTGSTMFVPTSTDITVPDSGLYIAAGWVDLDANSTGIRQLEIFQNASSVWKDARSAQSALTGRISITGFLVCTAGDVIEMWVYQSSGGALNVTAARFGVVRISG
jgi:hypothetical protein